jgi:hypothetical protein
MTTGGLRAALAARVRFARRTGRLAFGAVTRFALTFAFALTLAFALAFVLVPDFALVFAFALDLAFRRADLSGSPSNSRSFLSTERSFLWNLRCCFSSFLCSRRIFFLLSVMVQTPLNAEQSPPPGRGAATRLESQFLPCCPLGQ